MSKETQKPLAANLLASKKKAHVKLIGNELYRNKILSVYFVQGREIVLSVDFKNLVKAIKISSKFIEENNLEIELLNIKYWDEHAAEFSKSRNNAASV